MNKIFFSIIIFLIGLTAGYSFMIFAGYAARLNSDLIVMTVKFLKKHEMICFINIIDGFTNSLFLILTAIPVFLISGLLLVYFFKNHINYMKWISSLGILILPTLFGAFPAIYNTRFFDAIIILAVPLLMNLFFLHKIPTMINTPNKHEKYLN